MIKIAVTGGIACGKSIVGVCLRESGFAVCEADDLAHAVMAPGQPGYRGVVEAFGEGVLDGSGGIDRNVLGRRVFGDAGDLARLNRIIHPLVRQELERWMRVQSGRVAAIIPLLYEAEFDDGWDAVVCVTAPLNNRLDWLAQRGMTVSDARARMAAQLPDEVKAVRADYVLHNVGTIALLRQQTKQMLRSLVER